MGVVVLHRVLTQVDQERIPGRRVEDGCPVHELDGIGGKAYPVRVVIVPADVVPETGDPAVRPVSDHDSGPDVLPDLQLEVRDAANPERSFAPPINRLAIRPNCGTVPMDRNQDPVPVEVARLVAVGA